MTATCATVATSKISIALDSEGAISKAVLTRFFPDHETASLRGVRLRISGKKDLEEIRRGVVNAVRPVFVSHPGAEAGAVHIAKIALAVDDKELVFWVFSFGFSLTPQAVQGKLFFSAGLADVITRLFVSNGWPPLSPDTMLGLRPPIGQTATDASHEMRKGKGTRVPGSPL